MRRRRLSRRGERRVNRRDALEEIFEWIEGTNSPSCGWCGHPRCFECQAAHQRIRLAKSSAERAYEVGKRSNGHASNPEPRAHHQPYELESAYQTGYQEASHHHAAERARMQAEIAHVSRQLGAGRAPDPVMLEQARMQGYVAGVNAGRAMHQPMPQAAASNPAEIRRKVIEDVLNDCNVIGESNPNMKPAMAALRHRVKKH